MRQKPSKEKQLEYQHRFHEKHPGLKAKYNRDWIAKNRERYNASKYAYRDRVKRDVMAHYGKGVISCVKCGYLNIDALCLDHINNDGAQHRRELKIAGRSGQGGNIYEVLKKAGFPPGLQILCANCNLIKEIERKRSNRVKNQFYAKRIGYTTPLQAEKLSATNL